MPKYELMYLLGAQVSDDQVPEISKSVLKFVEEAGGTDVQETQLGKKKLAYPIKKTRNGHYVVVNFTMDSNKVQALDAKIRTQENTIIRYILVNLEEHLQRQAKDAAIAAKMPRREPVAAAAKPEQPAEKPQEKEAPKLNLELDQEELDKKIEEALSEDLTK